MDDQSRFLRHVDIFTALSEDELRMVASKLRTHRLEKGRRLFCEGDEGSELYIVRDGRLGISVKLADGNQLEIAEFGRGDFFGEMSIFENEPRSATCTVEEPSILYSLHENEIHAMIRETPRAAAKMMSEMLRTTKDRLNTTNRFLSDMVQWGEEARRRAITDKMTGMYNRRYLDDIIVTSFAHARENKRPLSIVMLDLDHFREINEQYSHEMGDAVIMNAVEVFRQHLRGGDIPARYGGDEFTFIFPDTDAETARSITEKIRVHIRELNILPDEGKSIQRVTTSQGIASYPLHAEDLKPLRAAADKALYAAKELGRDRVFVHGDSTE